jgi:O-antigen ligase
MSLSSGEVAPTPEIGGARAAWLGWVFVAVFVLTSLLAYLGPLGFAPLVALGGIFGIILVRQARIPVPALWPWIALVLWSGVSMIWSPMGKGLSLSTVFTDFENHRAFKLILQALFYGSFVIAAAHLPMALARRALSVLAIGLVLMSLLIFVEGGNGAVLFQGFTRLIDGPIRPDLAMKNVAQATYGLVLFIWPVSLFLSSRYSRGLANILIGLMFFGLIAASLLMGADAPLAALALGLLVLCAVSAMGRFAILLMAIVSTLYWIAAPLVVMLAVNQGLFIKAQAVLGASWDARLDIWSFTATKILQQPLWGWGLDASRSFGTAIPLHPHNAALQVWLELGVVGAVLMATAWLFLLKLISDLVRVDRRLAAVAAASASAYLIIGAVSFGVWQEWWLALGALTVAIIMAVKRTRPNSDPDSDQLLFLSLP